MRIDFAIGEDADFITLADACHQEACTNRKQIISAALSDQAVIGELTEQEQASCGYRDRDQMACSCATQSEATQDRQRSTLPRMQRTAASELAKQCMHSGANWYQT